MALNWQGGSASWTAEVMLERAATARVTVDGQQYAVSDLELRDGRLTFTLAGKRQRFDALGGRGVTEITDGRSYYRLAVAEDGEAHVQPQDASRSSLLSKMPGKVLTLNVSPGAQVKSGDVLLILEAMKMEHEISAPADGTVTSFLKQPGDRVLPGDLLVDFVPDD